MTRKGAINTAKGFGYTIRYSKNPKGYELLLVTSTGYEESEHFGTFEECEEKMAEIGWEICENALF